MSEKYRNYTAEDFAADDFFRKWVLEKGAAANSFWEEWLMEYPEKRQDIIQAVALLKTMHAGEARLTRPEIDRAVRRTLSKIREGKEADRWHQNSYRRWLRYAAVLALLIATWWGGGGIVREAPEITTGIAPATGEWVTIENEKSSVREQLLLDGSRVFLDPNSMVRYTTAGEGERTVLLTGSAFFEVVRNPERPFKVMTADLVTQVLGTSFRVSSDVASGETKVRVVTGKVEVSARHTGSASAGNTIVYPNQEVVFTQAYNQITKALVADPVEVQKPERSDFVYEDVPIGKIFDELGLLYGVTIHYDKERLAGCQINASFSTETFWEKLQLVCRPVRAAIEEKDGEVFIDSPGCEF